MGRNRKVFLKLVEPLDPVYDHFSKASRAISLDSWNIFSLKIFSVLEWLKLNRSDFLCYSTVKVLFHGIKNAKGIYTLERYHFVNILGNFFHLLLAENNLITSIKFRFAYTRIGNVIGVCYCFSPMWQEALRGISTDCFMSESSLVYLRLQFLCYGIKRSLLYWENKSDWHLFRK